MEIQPYLTFTIFQHWFYFPSFCYTLSIFLLSWHTRFYEYMFLFPFLFASLDKCLSFLRSKLSNNNIHFWWIIILFSLLLIMISLHSHPLLSFFSLLTPSPLLTYRNSLICSREQIMLSEARYSIVLLILGSSTAHRVIKEEKIPPRGNKGSFDRLTDMMRHNNLHNCRE